MSAPFFLLGWEALLFLAALFLGCCFLRCHCRCPPFRGGLVRGCYRTAASLPSGTPDPRVRRLRVVASAAYRCTKKGCRPEGPHPALAISNLKLTHLRRPYVPNASYGSIVITQDADYG